MIHWHQWKTTDTRLDFGVQIGQNLIQTCACGAQIEWVRLWGKRPNEYQISYQVASYFPAAKQHLRLILGPAMIVMGQPEGKTAKLVQVGAGIDYPGIVEVKA